MLYTDNYIIMSLELHLFFARIMKEHAIFLEAGFPCKDTPFIKQSEYYKNQFAKDYKKLLETSSEMNNQVMEYATNNSLEETIKFRDFKTAGTKGISGCKIQSIILPLLADHVLREANHYIRLLEKN